MEDDDRAERHTRDRRDQLQSDRHSVPHSRNHNRKAGDLDLSGYGKLVINVLFLMDITWPIAGKSKGRAKSE